MNRKTLLIIVAAVVVILLWPLADRSLSLYSQATTTITNEIIPYDETLNFEDCYGEYIHVTYDTHIVNRVTIDAEGRPHLRIHYNLNNLKAIGLETGTVYTGNETENITLNRITIDELLTGAGEPPWEFILRFVSKGQGQGSAPNFITHETVISLSTQTVQRPARSIEP